MPGAGRATARNAAWAPFLGLILIATIFVGVPRSSAAIAINPAKLLWLVKSNDLATLDQQASNDGVSLPAFTWVGCGGQSDAFHCGPGQVPIFTSYWDLRARALAGWSGTALFDIEPWSITPPAQRHDPAKWICLAAQLQQTDPKLKVVITPFARPPNPVMILEDAEAAQCGAYAVDVQSQFANTTPARFASFIRAAVSAIRRANPATAILAGLATNNPEVATAAEMTADYHAALAAGVQGFWLNANDWSARNQCTAVEGGIGCPETAIQFLEAIGMIAGGPATSLPSPGASTAAPGPPGSKPTAGTGSTTSSPAGSQSSGSRRSAAPQHDFVRLVLRSPLSRFTRLAGELVGGIAVIADCGCDALLAQDLLLGEVRPA